MAAGALQQAWFLSHSRLNPSRPLSSSSSSAHRPMVVTMAHNASYRASIEANIEAHLKNAIPIRHPVSVFEPMHYLTFSAPRTTAAALCIAACELVSGHPEDAMDAASVIHLMHAAAYAHENLPLTDRLKPKPAIHHAFGPNIELLTGDGIVPFGFELLARSMDPTGSNSDKILRVIIEITRAVGSQGYVDGQYREFECLQSNGEDACDVAWIEYVCEKKEGGLHACGAACGAILGGGSEEEIDKLRKYGLYLGTIQGMLYGVGKSEGAKMKIAEKLRALALKELEHFDSRKVEKIYSIIEGNLVNV